MRVQDPVKIRNMTRDEMDLAVEWAAAEGWNPGLNDAECFYHADQHGFFVATRENDVLCTCSAVRYDNGLAFGGFFIVRPDQRARGVGGQMLAFVLDHVRNYNFGIDGVPEMVGAYERHGFHFAYWNHRFEGIGGGELPNVVAPLSEIDFGALVEYDRSIFQASRADFLETFISQEGSTALGIEKNGSIVGYGVIRKCQIGHKIGPIFAEDPDLADLIFEGLAASVPGERIFLDVPLPNEYAVRLAEDHHLTSVFRTARMYTKGTPKMPLDRVFGVTSFELG